MDFIGKTTISIIIQLQKKLLLLPYSLYNDKSYQSFQSNKNFTLYYFIHSTREEIFRKLSISTSRKKKEKRKEIRMQEEQKLLTFDSLLNSFQ